MLQRDAFNTNLCNTKYNFTLGVLFLALFAAFKCLHIKTENKLSMAI